MNNTIEGIMQQLSTLQEKIKQQHIFIPIGHHGTIDPDIVTHTEAEGYIKIEPDIYGPFRPDIFFRPDTERVVFLEKESYHKERLNVSGYHGCDKVKEYGHLDWKSLGQDDVKLYHNAAMCAFALTEGRPMNTDSQSDQEIAVKRLRENVAFINANFFPMIASCDSGINSKDRLIYKWAQINSHLIIELLNLYDAEIVIGGSTLTHFCDPQNSTLFNQKVIIMNTATTHSKLGKRSGIIYYNADRIFLNAYHCSHPGFPSQIRNIVQIRDSWKAHSMKQWE